MEALIQNFGHVQEVEMPLELDHNFRHST
jgi:hypothetical protein